jgi:hypothetical protein
MKQYDLILNHLKEHGTITTWEAIQEYGVTRLSEYIRQLREDYKIEDEWIQCKNRYGRKVEYKKYRMGE